jgi:hypothetical protein
MLGICYIICMTRPNVCVASSVQGGCKGGALAPPYLGGHMFFAFVFSGFLAHGFLIPV